MKARTALFLVILWIIGAAFAAAKIQAETPNFDLTASRTCDCPDVRAELSSLRTRVDQMESNIQQLTRAVDQINEVAQQVKNTHYSQLATLEEQRQMARDLRSQASQVSSYTSAPATQTVQPWPVSQPWPTTQAQFATYRNDQGQLPRTMVGNQIVEASPAYEYTDSRGNLIRDYPVSISSQPVAEFPVSGYSTYRQPVTYSQPRRGFSICGPGGCR